MHRTRPLPYSPTMTAGVLIMVPSCGLYLDTSLRKCDRERKLPSPSLPIGDPEFLGGGERILRLFKGMLETGTPPVPYESFLLHIAVIEAAVLAQKQGGRVYLNDVWTRE